MFISFLAVLQLHNMSSSAVYILDVKGKVRLFLPSLNVLSLLFLVPVVFYIWVCCVWVVSVRPPVIFSDFCFRILCVLVHNSEVHGLASVRQWSVTAVAQLPFSIQLTTLTLHLHSRSVGRKLVDFAVRKVLAFAVFEE
jgi:hypothetical protein